MNKILAVAALFLSALFVSAPAYSTYFHNNDSLDLGTLDQGETWFSNYSSPYDGSFEDVWTFSLDQASRVSIEIKDIDFGFYGFQLLNINDLTVAFEGQIGGEYDWLTETLEAGQDYTFVVSGEVDGKWGGFYKGKIDVQPVPLPASAILFISGLVGLLGLRKQFIS